MSDFESQPFENLINQARAGDNGALGVLLSRYRNYLLLIANEDIDKDLKQKMGASDVVQESLCNVQKHFHQFRGNREHEFLAWIKVILSNDLKKQKRHFVTAKRNINREIRQQAESNEMLSISKPQPTPSRELMRTELERSLFDAISRLSPDHREVIQLRNFSELPFQEIGEIMNRKSDATRKLWARAIEALQSILAQENSSIEIKQQQARQSPESK